MLDRLRAPNVRPGGPMPEPKPIYSVPPEYGGRTARRRYQASLVCEECGSVLVEVTERGGKTVVFDPGRVPGERPVYIYRAQFVCSCGAERSFYSVPMSAIRLGIVEAGG